MTDGELLECFVSGRDDGAFAALVRRHAAMVWGVCRRVLPCHQDAEDAFQSTFLVLVRKAASVTPRHLVANWLYGVAHQTALNARASAARRRARERQVTEMPEPASPEQNLWSDLQPILDQELSRLPARYRSAIVLCDLEGKTRKDAARQLGVPEGTLSGWLTRGRAMLAKRLARHGLAVTGGALAAALAPGALAAGAPVSAVSATIQVASLWAAGQAAPGVISAEVAALTEGMLKTMLLKKLGLATVLFLMVSAAGTGAGGLIYRAHAANPTARAAPPAAERAADDTPKAPKPPPARTAARRERNKPNFTISKETTFLTEPLDKDGYVDYETALNERLAKDITPATNANALLWEALGPRPESSRTIPEYFQRLKIPAPSEHGDYFVGLVRYANEVLRFGPGELTRQLLIQRGQTTKRPWLAQDYPRIADWLKANDKPLALAVAATRRPDYYNPLVSRKSGDEGWYGLVGALLPGMQECRELATALAARAMLRAGECRFEEARQDLLACHRLGRLLARRAQPTAYRRGMAIDQIPYDADLALLELAQPTARQSRSWLRDLQHLPPLPPVADYFDLGGRFLFLDSVLHARRHGTRFLRLLVAIDPRSNARLRVVGPETGPDLADALAWDSLLRAGNAWFDRMAAAHRIRDRAAREREFERIENEVQAREKRSGSLAEVIEALHGGKLSVEEASQRLADALVGCFLQGPRLVRRSADLAEQRQRNLHLAFALAAYRGEHKRYPDKLDVLAPEYLAEVPSDLFSGKALIYRPSWNGYLLYSVGVNGRDDGGRASADTPPGDDLHVRMPPPPLQKN
jgi:RNA polymerase sigma factor (sigma-70 family)